MMTHTLATIATKVQRQQKAIVDAWVGVVQIAVGRR
jgi:hypothetical protein